MRRILTIFLATLGVAFAAPAVAPAKADAYLHVANAQTTAVNHVWYSGSPNCNQWQFCFQYPAAGAYNRINDTAVDVRVRGYFRAVPNAWCTRWLYVRGSDPGYIAGGTNWVCVS